MRKLSYDLDIRILKRIKEEIVPSIFTGHQFDLIQKRFSGKKMSASEKNEFSRTVSRKMNAIYSLIGKSDIFLYGKEKMLKERAIEGGRIIKGQQRKFKGKHIIITGSFLYKKDYNDIDIFVVTKYDKEDKKSGNLHINYVTPEFYNSLFFSSVKKLCISNKDLSEYYYLSKTGFDEYISLYQELSDDIYKKNNGTKHTLREFLLLSAILSKDPIPDSKELGEKTMAILSQAKPKLLVDNILINTIVIGMKRLEAINSMKEMIRKYKELSSEYPNHRKYYEDVITPLKRVIEIES